MVYAIPGLKVDWVPSGQGTQSCEGSSRCGPARALSLFRSAVGPTVGQETKDSVLFLLAGLAVSCG
jgi:hypothetical protein